MKHILYLDTRSAVWRRTRCEVEAETLEEALEKVKDFDYECLHSEFLYETEELMDATSEKASVEIFDDHFNCLYSNSKYDISSQ